MKRVNATNVIAGIALLAAGYVGGVLIGFPGAGSDKLHGDISQVGTEETNPEVQAMQELLMKDPQAQKQSIISTALLSSRIDVLDSLAEVGVKSTEGQKQLEAVHNYFVSLKRKTGDAKSDFKVLKDANEKVIKGEKVDNFETISNEALLSFFVLDNAISSDAVGDMLDYTRELNNEAASNAVAGWMAYCSENAEMKGNSKDVAMWKKVYGTLSDAAKKNYAESKKKINSSVSHDMAVRLDQSDKELKDVDLAKAINTLNAQGAATAVNGWVPSNDKISRLAYTCCNQGVPAPGIRVNF